VSVSLPGWELYEDDHLVTIRCRDCGKTYVFSAGGLTRDVLIRTMDDHDLAHEAEEAMQP